MKISTWGINWGAVIKSASDREVMEGLLPDDGVRTETEWLRRSQPACDYVGKDRIPSKANSKCQSPEVEISLVGSEDRRKARVTGISGGCAL